MCVCINDFGGPRCNGTFNRRRQINLSPHSLFTRSRGLFSKAVSMRTRWRAFSVCALRTRSESTQQQFAFSHPLVRCLWSNYPHDETCMWTTRPGTFFSTGRECQLGGGHRLITEHLPDTTFLSKLSKQQLY